MHIAREKIATSHEAEYVETVCYNDGTEQVSVNVLGA